MSQRRPTTTTRAGGALPDTVEYLRLARLFRQVAGQLQAGAERLERGHSPTKLRSEVVRMLSPLLEWGSTTEEGDHG